MSDYRDKVIQELQTDLDKHKWISVNDRLPEPNRDVLVYIKLMKKEYMRVDKIYNGHWLWYGYSVTHWMPLPNLPENIIYDRVGDDEESDAE